MNRDVLVYIFKVADFKTQIVMLRVSKIFKKSYITDIPGEYCERYYNIIKTKISSFTGLEKVFDYGYDLSKMHDVKYLRLTKKSKLQVFNMPYLTNLICDFETKFDYDNNYFPNLQVFHQNGYANFNFIEKHIKTLKRLSLSLFIRNNYAENVKPDVYNILSRMTNLTSLRLTTMIDYLPTTLTNLQELELEYTNIKNIDFSYYKNINTLIFTEPTQVNITNWPQSIVHLRINYIQSQNLLDSCINLTKLQYLSLKTNDTTNLDFLQYCTNLLTLGLYKDDNQNANLDFKHLTAVTDLTWLSVNNYHTINDSHVSNLTKLKTLRIEDTFITDNALANLQLTTLFTSCHITDSGISHMSSLEDLYINSPHIKTLDSLTSLNRVVVKNNTHITSDYVASLPNTPEFYTE